MLRSLCFSGVDSILFPVVFCWSCCPVLLSHMVLCIFNFISVNASDETKVFYGSITEVLSYGSPNLQKVMRVVFHCPDICFVRVGSLTELFKDMMFIK